jgi:hypothetical protein
VSYIPSYSDGKATLEYTGNESKVTLDFEISPKDAVVELAKVWDSAVSIKAVYTKTRAVSFVNMPIINFEADAEKGVISVTASGENLSEEFFAGTQEASVALAISDGNNSVTSEYIPLLAVCTPSGEEGVTPIFPESQSFELLAGDAQRLVFNANTAWTVSLENDYYAQLSYNNGEGNVFDTEVSGVAGEGIRVRVIMNEVIKNYDADVVFPVYIKMGSTTQTLATITVKQIERPAAISLPYPDPDVTFEEGGHPNWSPFKTAQHTYHMNYASQWVIEGVRLDCGLDTDYSIKTYAYTEGATDPVEFTTREDSWLTITYGLGENGNGFKVVMDLSKESAQWSWFATQYESYVNFFL